MKHFYWIHHDPLYTIAPHVCKVLWFTGKGLGQCIGRSIFYKRLYCLPWHWVPVGPTLHCECEDSRPRDAPASPLSTPALGCSHIPSPLSYSRVLFPVWTLVPGHSLANLYNSPSFGLNVPPYEHLLKKIGINEITAQPERPSSLYENQLIRHVFLFYWLHFRGLLIKWSLSNFMNSFRN